MRLTTPLGPDVLVIDKLKGDDYVSRPFEFTLDLLSDDAAINAAKLLRKPMSVAVDLEEGGQRFFHGLVRRFVQLDRGADNLVLYRAEIVPWLWFLTTASNCRIFQQKSVPDIVKQIFADHSMSDYRLALSEGYAPREYCVQYRETDLEFVSRLLEEEGIFYFFEHAEGKHTLVIADSPSAIKSGPVPTMSAAALGTGNFKREFIAELELTSTFFTGAVALTDYNMETPSMNLAQRSATTVRGVDNARFSLYDYPGNYAKMWDGDRLARIRMEEYEASSVTVTGVANGAGLVAGAKVEVEDHYRLDANKAYFVLSIQHEATSGSYRSEKTGDVYAFAQTFTAIPTNVWYRPPRVTPKAVVRGVQTAVVVGPPGEEIYVDKYGRVKVQFFWDREGKKDDKSSCYIRVSSTWAGKQWGFIQIPRIGQEVIVDFLEGDPDRPIIVGRVYNAEQMPPYELPMNKTQSGVKTRSSMDGGAADFNELRFGDMKGSEQILIHAQKLFDIEVEADETHWVGHDRKKTIDHDETVHVKHDRKETVDNSETITIQGARTETVGGDEQVTVSGQRTVLVKKDDHLQVDGQLETMISKDHIIMVDSESLTVQKTQAARIGKDRLTHVMGSDIQTLDQDLSVSAKGAITIESIQGIEIKVGQNSVKIDPSGITIKGMQVKIEGQIQTEVKGLITNVKADAMVMVKGAITMIN
jgi:type VI secretion system secreted protein VgrG